MSTTEQETKQRGRHAIVIGGSITGLLTARMLTDHFEQVTLLERDRYPQAPEMRKGVPQAHHPHALLVRGRMIMEQFFPNLADELVQHGALWFDYAEDGLLCIGGYRLPRFRSGVRTLSCSRLLLEWCVQRRVAAHPRIRILEETQATAIVADPGGTQIVGVRARDRGSAAQPEQTLHADLIVDASGRSSRAPEWLETLGYGRVTDTVINPFLGYATRLFHLPQGTPGGWTVAGLSTEYPHNPRGAAMMLIENQRLMVTLVGTTKHYPPTNEQEFLEFARKVPDPALYETIQQAEPLSAIYGYRGTENRLRHFERLSRWPERFVVLGDAVCAFNPIYAQGITIGAIGVLGLDECLRQQQGDLTGVARRFQRRLAKLARTPWMMATVEDQRWLSTLGGRPTWQDRIGSRYMNGLFAVMSKRPHVARTFLQVMHMIKPPTALFHPRILALVLRQLATNKRAASRTVSVSALNPAQGSDDV